MPKKQFIPLYDILKGILPKGTTHCRSYLPKDRFARGEDSGSAKLTTAQVIEIRALYDGKKSKTVPILAAKFKVSDHAIQRVIYRETWSHIK
jgi:hypothetical protein